jgi:hypothetical protein
MVLKVDLTEEEQLGTDVKTFGDKTLTAARESQEKKEKKALELKRKKIKQWKRVLQTLEKMEPLNHAGRIKMFNKLGTIPSGKISIQKKHENLLYTLSVLQVKPEMITDEVGSEVEVEEGKFINAVDIQTELKDLISRTEVKQILYGIDFILNEELDAITTVENALEEFSTTKIEYDIKGLSIYTVDEDDLDGIKQAIEEIVDVENSSVMPSQEELTVPLLAVLNDLFKEKYGEVPKHTLPKKYLTDFFGKLKEMTRRKGKGIPRKKPTLELQASTEEVQEGLDKERTRLQNLKERIEVSISELENFDIDSKIKEYEDRLKTLVKEDEEALEQIMERFASAKTSLKTMQEKPSPDFTAEEEKQLKSHKRKAKREEKLLTQLKQEKTKLENELEQIDGYDTSQNELRWELERQLKGQEYLVEDKETEVGMVKEPIQDLEDRKTRKGKAHKKEVLEHKKILTQLKNSLTQIKSNIAFNKKASISEKRKKIEDDLTNQLEEQMENLEKVDKQLEFVLEKGRVRFTAGYRQWALENVGIEGGLPTATPTQEEKKPFSRRQSKIKQEGFFKYQEFRTYVGIHARILKNLSDLIETEVEDMEAYIKKYQKQIEEADNYFQTLREKKIEEVNIENLEEFSMIMSLQKPTLTDRDIDKMQKLLQEFLQNKNKIDQIKERRSRR